MASYQKLFGIAADPQVLHKQDVAVTAAQVLASLVYVLLPILMGTTYQTLNPEAGLLGRTHEAIGIGEQEEDQVEGLWVQDFQSEKACVWGLSDKVPRMRAMMRASSWPKCTMLQEGVLLNVGC